MDCLVVRELIVTLIVVGVILGTHLDFYDNIIENASSIIKLLVPDLDCYDIYHSAVDKHGKRYINVLVGAASNSMLTILALAVMIFGFVDFVGTAIPDTVAIKWGFLIVLSLIVAASLIISHITLYVCCKNYAKANEILTDTKADA
jgi:hypothetical protein